MVQHWLISRNNRYSNKENYTAMKWKQRKQFWSFAWKETNVRIILAAASTAIVLVLFRRLGISWDMTEPVVTFLTLFVALAVGYQQMREEWEEDFLPKRLTARFFYGDTEVMLCLNARLGGEADIRALTQQIGRQMNNNKDLTFAAPDVEVSAPAISDDGKHVHYTAVVRLALRPLEIPENYKRIWSEPFIQNGQFSFTDQPLPPLQNASSGDMTH
jgi:hypothetical protein